MMSVYERLKSQRSEILRISGQHGAYNVRLFGSVLRGDDRPDSDIDILVELEPRRTLLDRIGLMQDLEDLLGRRVDVVTEKALHAYIRSEVLKQAVPL
jgi:predicted nucleotidyltransferase